MKEYVIKICQKYDNLDEMDKYLELPRLSKEKKVLSLLMK